MLSRVAEKPCREACQVGYGRCTRTALEVQMSDLLDNVSIAANTEVHLFQLRTPLCPRLIKSSCCNSVLVLHNSIFIYKRQVVDLVPCIV